MHHNKRCNATNVEKSLYKSNLIIKKMGKSTFRKIYDELPERKVTAPKSVWIKKIADLCMVHPTTVRCWLAGTQKPDALRISLLSKELGVAENELFN